MPWTSVFTFVTGQVLSALELNVYLRDNLNTTAPALVTTGGDLIYATGANTLSRLGIGTAFQALRVNSSAVAPEWASPIGNLITSSSPAGNSAAFSGITSIYKHLLFKCYVRTAVASLSDGFEMHINTDAGANYYYQYLLSDGAAAELAAEVLGATSYFAGNVDGNTAPANLFSSYDLKLYNYANSTTNKVLTSYGQFKFGTATGGIQGFIIHGFWNSIVPISRVDLFTNSTSNYSAGTRVDLYGLF